MGSEYIYEISSEDKKRIKQYINSKEQKDSVKFEIQLGQEPALTEEDEKRLEGKKDLFLDLDEFRHCRTALARISQKTLSNGQDDRPRITAKPTGFPTDDKYIDTVFQRCHLIGYQLLGKRDVEEDNENANLKRIFTGTCFMNNDTMYNYESQIAKYVRGTDNYVLYRVTPYFENNNLLAYGVQMEARFFNKEKKEDKERALNVFVYNKQPGIELNYETGEIISDES